MHTYANVLSNRVCQQTGGISLLHGRFYSGQLADDKCVLSQNRAATWHVEEYLGPYAFIDCEDGLVCLCTAFCEK